MREIKFRAWDGHRFWYSGTVGTEQFENWSKMVREKTALGETCVIQESTCLKDKNGKEIYENDILRFPEDVTIAPQEILYATNEAGTVAKWRTRNAKGWWGDPKSWSECEVIGNIYENPELLLKD